MQGRRDAFGTSWGLNLNNLCSSWKLAHRGRGISSGDNFGGESLVQGHPWFFVDNQLCETQMLNNTNSSEIGKRARPRLALHAEHNDDQFFIPKQVTNRLTADNSATIPGYHRH
uniref:Uncharacterized protein n=1 Tax=Eutreptiella gymnastica TaxID=73025 RepID=A0A7S4FU34_9EUGL